MINVGGRILVGELQRKRTRVAVELLTAFSAADTKRHHATPRPNLPGLWNLSLRHLSEHS
jgi:hypothetical protein